MTRYWHGGRYPSDGVLTPQPTMRSGRLADGWVYITTDRDLAMTYAATLPGSWVMEVEPDGAVERDPESILGYSYRCRRAVVRRRYSIPAAERAERSRIVGALSHQSKEPSSCCAACDRFGDDGDPTARGCGLPDCSCHEPTDPEPDA